MASNVTHLHLVGSGDENPKPPAPIMSLILVVRAAETACLSFEEYPELVVLIADLDFYKRNIAVAILKVMSL